MANYDKWTKGAAGHLCQHFERAKNDNGEYINFGNRDIDTSRSHLNYNLAPERKSQYGFIADRCKELKCLNRKDVIVLASWIVTAPADLPDDKLEDFFKANYKILEKRYGKENVVSAYVHMDESGRPHMHFAFIPVVWDKKKEAWKVSAKQCVTRTDLQKFHPWLEAELKSELGFDVNIVNEATVEGNKTVTELKRERELQKQAELAKATDEAQDKLDDVCREIKIQEQRLEEMTVLETHQEYIEKSEQARNILQELKNALQELFNRNWIFRNRTQEKRVLQAFERGIEVIGRSLAALIGFELAQRVPEQQRRSKVITKSLDEIIINAQRPKEITSENKRQRTHQSEPER